jgi:hypothetical protein
MFGSKGFRAKEATANYKRRIRKLQTDEVRAVRFANLHGNAEPAPAAEPEAVEPAAEVEVTLDAQPEQTEAPADEVSDAADEAADEAGDEDSEAAGDEEGNEDATEGEADAAPAEGETAQKKKAGKAKKKAGK